MRSLIIKSAGEPILGANFQQANKVDADFVPTIHAMKAVGRTLAAIAYCFNADDHTTRTGNPFSPVQVMRILDRSAF